MADFQNGIPDITVIVTKGSEYVSSIQTSEVYQVLVNTGDSYLVNVDQPYTIVVAGSGSYTAFSDFASNATSASYSITASHLSEILLANTAPITPKTGSVYFSGSFLYVYNGMQYTSASLN